MPDVAIVLASVVVAFALGAAAAWVATGRASNIAGEGPRGWRTITGAGSERASLFARATIARVGIWALPPSEVIYFNAERDDEGRPLDVDSIYEISGGDLPARWWSIGGYVGYHWVDDPAGRYSYTRSNVARDADGRYVIRLSRIPQPGNWLPLGSRRGPVTLIARLYQPHAGVADCPGEVPLPTIRRLTPS